MTNWNLKLWKNSLIGKSTVEGRQWDKQGEQLPVIEHQCSCVYIPGLWHSQMTQLQHAQLISAHTALLFHSATSCYVCALHLLCCLYAVVLRHPDKPWFSFCDINDETRSEDTEANRTAQHRENHPRFVTLELGRRGKGRGSINIALLLWSIT